MPTMIQTIEIKLPCLISVDKDLNQPRLPSYKVKKATKNKEITAYGVCDFEDSNEMHYGMNGSATQVIRIFPPTSNSNTESWEGTSDELATKIADKIVELKIL